MLVAKKLKNLLLELEHFYLLPLIREVLFHWESIVGVVVVIPLRRMVDGEERKFLGKESQCKRCKVASGMAFMCSILAQFLFSSSDA